MICITESKIRKGKDTLSNISLPGYTIESIPTESANGGVLLYIASNIQYKIRNDLEMYMSKELESVFIEILQDHGKNTICGGIYKHPGMSIEDFNTTYLNNLLDKLSGENKYVVLLGDFNINLLKYDTDNSVSHFLDSMYQNSLQPHITAPTRITPHSKTLITFFQIQ